ncbi:MAG: WD40 repeat domain-containing protein [Kineosporiaceae bacterium]
MTATTVSGSSGTATPAWELDLGEPVTHLAALDGGGVVAGGSEGALVAVGADGRIVRRLHLGDPLLTLAVSPDGTRLAAGGGNRLALFDLTVDRVLADRRTRWCGAAAWAAHSRDVVVGDGRRCHLLGREGELHWTSPELASTVAGLAFLRPDGRRVAAAAYQGVTLFEPAADRLVEQLAAPGAIAGLTVSPNGRWVVGGSQDATLHGWKVPAGGDFRMSGFPTTVSRLAFEPAGRWLACDGGDAVALWDFSGAGPTGRRAALAVGHRGPVRALGWLPAASTTRALVSGDAAGDLALWRLDARTAPGDQLRPAWTVRTGDPVEAVTGSADLLISGHRSGTLAARRRPAGA